MARKLDRREPPMTSPTPQQIAAEAIDYTIDVLEESDYHYTDEALAKLKAARTALAEWDPTKLLARAVEFEFETGWGTIVVRKTEGDTPSFYAKSDADWLYRSEVGAGVNYGFCPNGDSCGAFTHNVDDHFFDTIDALLDALSLRIGEEVVI